MSTPELPGAPWTRFRTDPRSGGDLRAGDGDRDVARQILAEAYADGQLDRSEHDQRIEDVMRATHLGNLVPVVQDLSVPAVPSQEIRLQPVGQTTHQGMQRPGALRPTIATWVFVSLIVNAVWAATSFSSGEPLYYWPIWPMLGVAIPVLAVLLFGDRHAQERSRRDEDRELRRDRRRAERRRELE